MKNQLTERIAKRMTAVIIAALLMLALPMGLLSCGGQEAKTYTVGICQLTQHAALDAATQGFMDAVTAALGDSVVFDVQNASGDSAVCATIVNAFVAKNVDLIMANATPALQAAYNATETIPILGTSVTEYSVALNLQNFSGTVGSNVSGTSDLAPLDEQAQMILDLVPTAQTVGILYCSAEPNSTYQVKAVTEYLTNKGLTVRTFSFADSNDVAAVTERACAATDVLYVPTDNTAASCSETIGNVVKSAAKPVIAGEAGLCTACGIATLSISYYDLGYKTGEMAVAVLTGKSSVSTMPIAYAAAKKMYNPEICAALGITPPADYAPLTK